MSELGRNEAETEPAGNEQWSVHPPPQSDQLNIIDDVDNLREVPLEVVHLLISAGVILARVAFGDASSLGAEAEGDVRVGIAAWRRLLILSHQRLAQTAPLAHPVVVHRFKDLGAHVDGGGRDDNGADERKLGRRCDLVLWRHHLRAHARRRDLACLLLEQIDHALHVVLAHGRARRTLRLRCRVVRRQPFDVLLQQIVAIQLVH